MKQLNPKAVWLFFWTYFFGLLVPALIFSFYFSAVTSIVADRKQEVADFSSLISLLGYKPYVILAALLMFCFIWAKLSYRFYKYELTDLGFKKEHGVIWKKYVTIPYERIQNVDIYRGVIARILGLSDLHIQTAGMSASRGVSSEGRLPGLSIADAEQLRDELVRRAKNVQNS